MATHTITQETVTKVSPHRLFKAMILHRDVTMMKVKPDLFKSSDLIEGDGGAGSIRKVHFVDGHPVKYFKLKIDELDAHNFYTKYTIFEGDILKGYLEKIVYTVKYEAAGDGCKASVKIVYHAKPGCAVDEQHMKIAEEKGPELFKAVENYLLDNPSFCT